MAAEAAGNCPDPLTEADFAASAQAAPHVTEPARFVARERASQGLGEPAAPAPVPAPPPGQPRGGSDKTNDELGVLAGLRGAWSGSGFNLIARPDHQHKKTFFLELNATKEVLEFTPISGQIPNRGSKQDDIFFLGLTYLQRISDAESNGGLHIEPGIWINVPQTEVPDAPPSIVRLATIPHGNSVLAQGHGFEVDGGPTISPASTTPVDAKTNTPIDNRLGYLDPYLTAVPPPGIPLHAIPNPNVVLKAAIEGQEITKTAVLLVASEPIGGIENIPFLQSNANVVKMSATFWIETIQLEGGTRLQLQYSQTVILNFAGINWPHVSVATLVKF